MLGIYIKLGEIAKNQSFVLAKTLRVLPPGGGFPGPLAVLRELGAFLAHRSSETLLLEVEQELRRHFLSEEKSSLFFDFTSSGKSSLYKIALEVGRGKKAPVAAISSYTCPDIAAVLVKAGYSLSLFDIDPLTLQPKIEGLSASVDLLLLSNLFGLVDQFPDLTSKIVIIDDACQAGLSHIGGIKVGTRGDYGISSFGRGKVFPGIGGGLSLQHFPIETSPDFDTEKTTLVFDILKSQLMWFCQFPMIYRFPASIKSLGLGTTVYKSNFVRGPISLGRLLITLTQLRDVKNRIDLYRRNSDLWHSNLTNLRVEEPLSKRDLPDRSGTTLIRYPIIVLGEEGRRDRILSKLRRSGLGASGSYPCVLSDYQELRGKILDVVDSGARKVASSILTLPVHKFLRESDIQNTVRIIKETD